MRLFSAFFVLISIAIIISGVDFFLNDYDRFLVSEEITGEISPVGSLLTEEFFNALPENTEVIESSYNTTLFSRLDISALEIDESLVTLLTKDLKKYASIYEFSGGEKVYFQLRDALELILRKDDSLFDANNLGDYSFYYNDSRDPNIVYMISLIQSRVFAFEYPRENHEEFKELTKILANSLQIN